MARSSNAPPLSIAEVDFQEQVLDLFHACGWDHNFVRRTRGRGGAWTTSTSKKGWPDLTLWTPRHGGLLILRELKTETGKVSAEQEECIASLRLAKVDAKVWRPSDWSEIEKMATKGPTRVQVHIDPAPPPPPIIVVADPREGRMRA